VTRPTWLSPALKAAHPEIPWPDIAGFRNRLVHAYLDIDLEVAWATLENDLAGLKELAVNRELPRLRDEAAGEP
jgi:uncharacterized protein with HEPN domain